MFRDVPDFRTLAQRLTRRTADLIAIGLLCAVGLTLGRQLIAWWSPNSSDQAPISSPGGLEERSPDWIGFGDGGDTFRVRVVSGSREEATDLLARLCLEVQSERGVSVRVELLDHLRTQPVVRRSEDRWCVDVPAAAPMVACLEERPVDTSDADRGRPVRLVCWGLAVPAGADRWQLMCYENQSGRRLLSGVALPDLPPSSQRTMTVGWGRGGLLVGFQGEALRADWETHFRSQLRLAGWHRTAEVADGQTWQRTVGNGGEDNSTWTLYLAVRETGGTTLHGLMTVNEASPQTSEDSP